MHWLTKNALTIYWKKEEVEKSKKSKILYRNLLTPINGSETSPDIVEINMMDDSKFKSCSLDSRICDQ